jgi:hypothetical protein
LCAFSTWFSLGLVYGLGFEGSVSQVHSAVAGRQNEIEIGQISELGAQESAVEDDAPDYDGAGAHYLERDGDLVNLAHMNYNKNTVSCC